MAGIAGRMVAGPAHQQPPTPSRPTGRSVSGSIPPSRSSTPKPYSFDKPANDHTVSWRSRPPPKDYPPDCPPLNVRWYYAVDVPKRTTYPSAVDTSTKPAKQPSKYVPFGKRDSHAIEAVFQRLAEAEETSQTSAKAPQKHHHHHHPHHHQVSLEDAEGDIGERHGPKKPKRRNTLKDEISDEEVKVPVNEDYLFDVDIRNRELSPVYWLGPSYDVRRGTWFYQEGSTLRPCDENLAMQLEEAYLKVSPFRQFSSADKRPVSRGGSNTQVSDNTTTATTTSTTTTSTTAPPPPPPPALAPPPPPPPPPPQESLAPKPPVTRRLFGEHMNSFVLFADASTAWIMTDDFYGKLSSTVYQRITSGNHMGGTKVVRGYSEGSKASGSDTKKPDIPSLSVSRPVTPTPETKAFKAEATANLKRRSMPPPSTGAFPDQTKLSPQAGEKVNPRRALERQLSSLEAEKGENQMLEEEMKEDYNNPDDENSEDQGREIEYLLLTTHGIGQRLSERLASVNFVHDVNIFRKTLKSVYGYSPDLQALNDEFGESKKNCKIQCLPVCWRHLVDFPERSLRQNRNLREHDLGSGSQQASIEEEYPSLADITVEGVPSVRSLITDLALDILLYQSPTYREHIARTVLEECNRIYALFRKRNPGFRGKVSLVGHSLGSAILFDLLCRQPDRFDGKGMGFKPSNGGRTLMFDFPVDNLFCLGSPIGLFQMLKGRNIAARNFKQQTNIPESPLDPEYLLTEPPPTNHANLQISSPACAQLYNIFHPTDPISYRIEPLVSRAMADLKPQPLPYTKRGIWAGTTQLAGGISGIGQSVSKSVSGFWSSLSSGIASSILNRSLGITDGDVRKGGEGGERAFERMKLQQQQMKAAAARGGGASGTGAGIGLGSGTDEEIAAFLASSEPGKGGQQQQEPPATLIDGEIETLYEGFQRSRRSAALSRPTDPSGSGTSPPPQTHSPTQEDLDLEQKAAQLKHEEAKVRALNSTGRIDFAIQEGVFDLSLISSLASHLGYWNDEDVAHFMISQLCSGRAGWAAASASASTGGVVGMEGGMGVVGGGVEGSRGGGGGGSGCGGGRKKAGSNASVTGRGGGGSGGYIKIDF